jgi:hypothetical protein
MASISRWSSFSLHDEPEADPGSRQAVTMIHAEETVNGVTAICGKPFTPRGQPVYELPRFVRERNRTTEVAAP